MSLFKKQNGQVLTLEEQEKRMTKAAEEFFFMTTIAVRMNLAEQYDDEDIMTAKPRVLWEMCKKLQIPMNKFYLYIEQSLREQFNLPELAFRLLEPKKSLISKEVSKCSIM